MYFDGTTPGINKNTKEGYRLRIKAADLGCPVAQHNLGVDYELGRHFTKDMNKAVTWYKKSANQDNDLALYELGRLYMFGIGVPKDLKIAKNYFEKAASLKNEEAQARLEQLQNEPQEKPQVKTPKTAKK